MKNITILLISILLFSLNLKSQTINLPEQDFNIKIQNHSTVENPGMAAAPNHIVTSRDALDPELEDTLQTTIEAYLDQLDVVGLSVAANVQGDIWTGTAGINTGITPVTDDLVFAIGSVSKTLTAACILDMYEEGLLLLDDPIDNFLPDYEYVDSLITIRQMLNHTSGIYNYTNHPNFSDSLNADLERIWTPAEVMDNFVNSPLFIAGTNWAYSNTNYILLGLIIEEVSGNAYHIEVKNRLLDPLGLNSVKLYPYETLNNNYAHIWFDVTGTGADPVDFYDIGGSLDALFSAAWAAGAYVSTPEDMTLWVKALYNGEVLSQNTLDEVQITVPFGSTTGYLGYGLGTFELLTSCADESAWGHGGDIIYSSQDYYFPQDDISIAVHFNDGSVNSNFLIDLVDELHCLIINFVPTSNNFVYASEFNYFAFPNPFEESISINYHLNGQSNVEIGIYDVMGQQVELLKKESQEKGDYSINWNSVNSGLYFIRFEIDSEFFTEKLIKL